MGAHNESAGEHTRSEGESGSRGEPSSDPPLRVFVNYRHEDAQPTAWALYLKLEERFGEENVFFDRGTLRPGMEWFTEIKSRVAGGGAFITLIGPGWLDSLARRMRTGDQDYVAAEIELALRAGPTVTVIPVLVDRTQLPGSEELPPSIREIRERHVMRLRYSDLRADIDALIAHLEKIEQGGGGPAEPQSQRSDTSQPLVRRPVTKGRRHGPVAPAPDDEHFAELAEETDNLVVFLGAGVNAEDLHGSLPDDVALAKYLAEQVGLDSSSPDLAEIAQYARTMRGEARVFQWVRRALAVESEPGPVHRYLARLPARLEQARLGRRYQMIVTTKYDAALEKAFREEESKPPFDVAVFMGPGTEQAGTFVHVPWGGEPRQIVDPNGYRDLPIAADGQLMRNLIVRINGSVDDPEAGYTWKDNYVLTEDDYIGYLSGHAATQILPAQILAKLNEASYLFLGYTLADWRLRVFLKRVWPGSRLGRARSWAIESEPDVLERELWRKADVTLYEARLTDYVDAFERFLCETWQPA